MKILAIETSCDETAAAVVEDGRRLLSSKTYSQIALHALYGGVVPEIASRKHMETLGEVVDGALFEANLSRHEIDALAVTAAPGLIGALLTGLSFAKGAAAALDIPLIPVHHIRGHIASNYLAFPELTPPFACLVVSGGHTLLLDVADYGDIGVRGSTRDDAAGECFDKIARALGYPYPGGRELDLLASGAPEDLEPIRLPRPHFDDAPLDFSFSGLKTAVINLINTEKQRGGGIDEHMKLRIAKSVSVCIADILTDAAIASALADGRDKIALAGGVAANSFLRRSLAAACEKHGLSAFIPPAELCGDNAAMIGSAGYYAWLSGEIAGPEQNAFATMEADMFFCG